MKNLFTIFTFILFYGTINAHSWSDISKSLPISNTTNYQMGYSVAIDGDYAVAGSYYHITNTPGRAFVMHNNSGTWERIATLSSSENLDDGFGEASVDIEGDVIVISYRNGAFVFVKPASGWETMTETAKLSMSNSCSNCSFGRSLSLSGDVIVVGAPGHDEDFANSGSVFVYEKPTAGWKSMTETAQLDAADMADGDGFGEGVCIFNDIIVVGAPKNNTDGSVYVFEKPVGGWVTTTSNTKLTLSVAAGGYARDVFVNDDNIIVGAPWYNGQIGAVYVFEKPVGGWISMNETAELLASDGASNNLFGTDFSMDGETLVVGAYQNTNNTKTAAGAAYIFKKPATGWINATESAKLTSSKPIAYLGLASGVGISGDNIILGAFKSSINYGNEGAAYIYEKDGADWVSTTEDTIITPTTLGANNYGSAVSIDGDYAVVGVPGDRSRTGCAYVLYNNNGTWEKQAVLTASNREYEDEFGISVNIFGDNIVVGTIKSNSIKGSAYVFVKPTAGWSDMTEDAILTASDGSGGFFGDRFGISVAVSTDVIVVGANADDDGGTNTGSAYLFVKPGGGWSDMTQTAKLTDSNAQPDDNLGVAVAISGDYIVVGAHVGDGGGADDGVVCVYSKPGGGWISSTQTARLRASDGNLYFHFGYSVSIDAGVVAVGAYNADSRKGAVYLYEKPVGGWIDATQDAKLTASARASKDYFGYSVSIKNDNVVAGAIENTGSATGSAYIFEKPGSGWIDMTETKKITPSDGQIDDKFGTSVGISASNIVIGAPYNDELADNSGGAYFYGLRLDQTITFGALSTKTYGDASYTISASGGSSGNSVVFSSSNTDVATCSGTNGTTITIVGAGTCTIYANQEGSATYHPAPQVQQALTVNKYPITITVDAGQTKIYGNNNPSYYTRTSTPLVNGDSFSGSLTRDAGEDVGDYNITIGTYSAGDNYSATFNADVFTIAPKPVTVQPSFLNKIYGKNNPVYTYTADDLLNGDVYSGSLTRVVGEDVGNYNITIGTLTAGSNYSINLTTVEFIIKKKNIDVIIDAGQTKVYGEPDPVFTYTSTLLEAGDTFTGLLNRGIGVNAGSYIIKKGTVSAGVNYNLLFQADSFRITQAPITITVDAGQSKKFGDPIPIYTYTATPLSNGDTFSGKLERVVGKDVGSYAINQGTLTAGNNYSYTFESEDFEILQLSIVITVDADQSKTYGGVYGDLDYSISPQLVIPDEFSGSLVREVGENVGAYAITQGTLSASSNYSTTFVGDDFTIIKKGVKVTPDFSQTKKYGESDPVFTYTSMGLVNGDTFTGKLSRVAGENVGAYAMTQGTLTAGSNYDLTFGVIDFDIMKKAVYLNPDSGLSKIYNESDPSFTYTVDGLENGDVATGILSRTTGEDVKIYTITQGTVTVSNNYNLIYTNNVKFNILPKQITVTADAGQTKLYNDANPIFTYTSPALLPGNDFFGELEVEVGDDVGTYAITIGSLHAGINYNVDFVSNDFEILPKPVSVTVRSNQHKVYGDSNPTYAYNGGALSYTGALSREPGEDAGTYAITQGTLSIGSNYSINFISDDFEIKPMPIIITADDGKSKVYGEDDPIFTYTATELINGDTYSGALVKDPGEDVKTNYAISLGTLTAGPNYTIDFNLSVMSITRRPITVTVDANQSKLEGESDPIFTYSSDNLVFGDSFTGELERAVGVSAGLYPIYVGSLSIGLNYSLSFVSRDFEIRSEPKPITVTVTAGQTKVFGSTDPEFSYTATSLDNGDSFTGELTRVAGDNIGTYAISQGTLTAGSSYAITFVSDDFEITPKPITVTVDAGQSKIYGAVDPIFTYTATNLENGDKYSGTLNRIVGENIGSYSINQGLLTAGVNYLISFETDDFIITKATSIVTWENPESIVEGTALSLTQLNATANIKGDFVYSPSEGAMLQLGDNQELTVLFTPNDTVNYTIVGKLVFIDVTTSVSSPTISENSILVYPNPTSGIVNVDMGDNTFDKIIVTDMAGSIIVEKNNVINLEFVDLSDFMQGIYLINFIKDDSRILIKKIVKE